VSFLILTFSSDFDFSSWTFTSGFFSTIGSLLFFDLELARIDISLMMERPRPDFLLSSSSASGVESTFFVDFFRSFGELSLPLNDPNLALASSLMLTFSSDFDVTSSTFSSGFFSVYESLLFLDWERARIDIALMMERPRPDFFSSSISGSFSTLLSPSSAVESLLFFDLERARTDISLIMVRPRPDFFSPVFSSGFISTFFNVLPLSPASCFLRVADLDRLRSPVLRVVDLDDERPLELERFFFSTVTSPAFSIIFCEKDGAFVRFPERPERLDLEADLDRLRLFDELLFEDLASFSTSGVEASSAAGSSRASSSTGLSPRASPETDGLLPSRPSGAATSGGDGSTPASASCLAGAPASTALAEWTDMVGDSPMSTAVS